jgi:hypothetical protein
MNFEKHFPKLFMMVKLEFWGGGGVAGRNIGGRREKFVPRLAMSKIFPCIQEWDGVAY